MSGAPRGRGDPPGGGFQVAGCSGCERLNGREWLNSVREKALPGSTRHHLPAVECFQVLLNPGLSHFIEFCWIGP